MTNGILKLFLWNIKTEQKDIIDNLLKLNGWKLADKPSNMYGDSDEEEWQHFSFTKKDAMITINIGVDHYESHKPVFFYEVNYYGGDEEKNDKFNVEFTDLDDYEYYFNKALKAMMKFAKY